MRFCVRFCFVLSFVLCVQSAVIGENIYHTVEKGDTLYSLAKKYGVTMDDIRRQRQLHHVAHGRKTSSIKEFRE